MQAINSTNGAIEGEIWTRLIQPGNGTFPRAAAQELLMFNFTEAEKERMHDLAKLNSEGKLSGKELAELEGYIRVANVLALLHAKAQRSLKKR
jgi:hypothetical protein